MRGRWSGRILLGTVALLLLESGCAWIGPPPDDVSWRGTKRFDRFACFNLTAVARDFHLLLRWDDGTETPIDVRIEPGSVSGQVFRDRRGVTVTRIECEVDGHHCVIETPMEEGLRSAMFWFGQEEHGVERLCGNAFDAGHYMYAVPEED